MFFFFRFVFVFSYILVLAINDKSHSPRVPRRPETAAVGFSVFFQLLKSRNRSQEAIFLDHKLPKFKINHTLTHAHAKKTNTSCTRSFA